MRTKHQIKKRVIILGAGISGLALGWFFKQRFKEEIELTILEKESCCGGWVRTHNCSGFLFESGPRSCRTAGHGIATLQLIESLGLQDEVIAASPAAKKRFLYFDRKLQQLPTGLASFLTSPLTKGILPAIGREWYKQPQWHGDETIYEFISRRLGSTIAERLVDPMVTGIYAGDIRQLSMQACFPDIFHGIEQHGSMLGMLGSRIFQRRQINYLSPFVQAWSKHSIFTLRQGMGSLVNTLENKLKNDLRLNCEATSVDLTEEKIHVKLRDGSSLNADQLFCTLPAYALQELIKVSVPKIEYTSVAVVNMGWGKKVLKHEGFGYLIPSQEQENVLGVVWDSSAFPQQNANTNETRLTVMLGGTHRPDITLRNEQEIRDTALNAVRQHLGIEELPKAILVSCAKNAIPQYKVGHKQKVKDFEHTIQQAFKGKLTILGNAWNGVSLNDCIAQAYLNCDSYHTS